MIKFKIMWTIKNNHRIGAALLGNKYILNGITGWDGHDCDIKTHIEEILEHFLLVIDKPEQYEWYEWKLDEGLFKIDFFLKKKLTRDWPPWTITDVKWKFISSDLKAFELLYNKGDMK